MDNELKVTDIMRPAILSSMSWLQFLTILSTIGMVLIFLMGILVLVASLNSEMQMAMASQSVSPMAFKLVGFIYILTGLICLYPIIQSFALISNTRRALRLNNQQSLEKASFNMRNALRYQGILAIIFIILYIAFFIFAFNAR